MDHNKNLTINEVCQLLKTTPRTLRYYESVGLITSTRKTESTARLYSPLELETIKQVLLLRSIHLSMNEIKDLMAGKCNLNQAINNKLRILYLKREDLLRQINVLKKASNLLLDQQYIDSSTLDESLQDKEESELKSFIITSTMYFIKPDFKCFIEKIEPNFFQLIDLNFFQNTCCHIIKTLGTDIVVDSLNIITKEEVHVVISGSLCSYLLTYSVISDPDYRITGILFTNL